MQLHRRNWIIFLKRWEKEVSDAYAAVEKMYKEYQNDVVLLSREAKQREKKKLLKGERSQGISE